MLSVKAEQETERGKEKAGHLVTPHLSSSTPQALPTGPLVPGTGLLVLLVVAAVVPVDAVVVALSTVGRAGWVQPVRVEGVGGGGGGPGSGASPLRLGGAPGPAEQQTFSDLSIQRIYLAESCFKSKNELSISEEKI